MPIQPSKVSFLDGEWLPWDDAKVHVTTHALHYGSSVFEGIRAYNGKQGTGIFRLGPHLKRLLDSCKLLHMPVEDYPQERLHEICIEAVTRNDLDECYLRPVFMRSAGGLGLYPLETPVSFFVFAVKWGRYLGQDAIEKGVDAMVSSWRRFNASTSMPLGKIGGQYVTSQMVSIEARKAGFGEGILLDERGNVCEGAGENLFAVMDGEVITPPLASSILGGITRDSAIRIAEDLGITVRYAPISRDMLYLCDELFMTGTAAEITPVRSVDRIAVGNGSRGPITERIQEQFFAIVEGRTADRFDWLTPVPAASPARA